MGRVLAIDWGKKRTGIAISDSNKIIANALETIETNLLLSYLKEQILKLEIDTIVLGYPKDLQNRDTDATPYIDSLLVVLKKQFDSLNFHLVDERFTSKIAKQTIFQLGINKKKRKEKERVDQISAVIILQDFLGKKDV